MVTNKVCSEYNLFSVEFYSKKKENEIVEIRSTESFPIFAFVNKTKDGKEWIKVLQPKSQDKAFRFFYVRGRPSDFVFGLNLIQKEDASSQNSEAQNTGDNESNDDKKEDIKIPRIIIASGDRDGVNARGAGEFVILLNSETAQYAPDLYNKLMKTT